MGGQPACGGGAAGCAHPAALELRRRKSFDHRSHAPGLSAGDAGGDHPQHPVPEVTASALAVLPQQLLSAAASAAVPQHGLAAAGSVVAAGVLPQQPPAAAGLNASAGLPVKPPAVLCEVLMIVSPS